MAIEHVLAGLTAKSVSLTPIPQGTVSRWTMAERIGLLRGLTGPALAWAYWRHLGHTDQLGLVERHLIACIGMFCAMRKYRLGREVRAGIVNAALAEASGTACPRCRGEGRAIVAAGGRSGLAVCPRCAGSGIHRLTHSEQCRIARIARTSWRATHDAVMTEACRLISELEQHFRDVASDNYRRMTAA